MRPDYIPYLTMNMITNVGINMTTNVGIQMTTDVGPMTTNVWPNVFEGPFFPDQMKIQNSGYPRIFRISILSWIAGKSRVPPNVRNVPFSWLTWIFDSCYLLVATCCLLFATCCLLFTVCYLSRAQGGDTYRKHLFS